MTDYVKSTNFTSKDSLASGNPLKIVKGAEFDTEFNNIATAVATKADIASPTLTGVPAAPTAAAGTNTTQIATTAFVTAAVTAYDAALTVSTTQIENDAITADKIATGAVGNTELAADAVTQAKIADSAVGTAEIIDNSVTAAKITTKTLTGLQAKALANYPVLTVTAADTYSTVFGDGAVSILASTTSTSYVAAYRYTIALYTGSIRLKASHCHEEGYGGQNSYLALYKNNVLVQEYSTTSNTFVQRTADVSCAPGDVFEWRTRSQFGATSYFQVIGSTASNGYTTRPLYIAALDA